MGAHGRILVVDDDTRITTMLTAILAKDGHEITVVNDPRKVLHLDLGRFDLILCDVMMPKLDGFELVRRIRKDVACPILFLTAKTDEDSAVLGYGLGADDYVRKPFGAAELRAKVNAHLRSRVRQAHHPVLRFGRVTTDLLAGVFYVDELEVPLTGAEYRICEFLAEQPGRDFSREQIWDGCLLSGDDSLDMRAEPERATVVTTHMSNIRRKFAVFGVEPIKTVWSVGYRWVA
ncbi:DNA-binding response regulator, OmpR family, contains REC and winged-helix (wHTH) domain [Bifidobacterium bohemicum]|uniref:Two-component response regulator n=2 Tax=Bifidobacterium bohemicum TaxID=638617 RepID=A0A086ZGG6_9BIFI|nr:two-component response regulator [Bifidobacterium bohemicum DSM 22767]SCC00527.1 DNA-binding response regulator, OmpR family, contains REC and winged-helix (wHTH) domain [Bifidobacterium bohemicum]